MEFHLERPPRRLEQVSGCWHFPKHDPNVEPAEPRGQLVLPDRGHMQECLAQQERVDGNPPAAVR